CSYTATRTVSFRSTTARSFTRRSRRITSRLSSSSSKGPSTGSAARTPNAPERPWWRGSNRRCSKIKTASRRSGKWRNMIRRIVNAIACASLNLLVGQNTHGLRAQSQDQTEQAAATKNDYSKAEAWLCRPGRQDACAADLTTTVVAANGKLTEEKWKADPKAPIDCFYVYPTVSNDQTPNSDMDAGPEERSVVQHQFARFGSQCRPYAPLYRQVTLTALRANLSGKPMRSDRALAYNDVLDAWKYYLEHDNQGRGVVLIGHSQGSGVLIQLIKNEIDGKPIQDRVVSALLLGMNVAVPAGKDVGGSFQKMPLCCAPNQTGCVISYVTFRENAPPPSNSFFGRAPGEGMVVACTNPAALGGGRGELHAYLAAGRGAFTSSATPKP